MQYNNITQHLLVQLLNPGMSDIPQISSTVNTAAQLTQKMDNTVNLNNVTQSNLSDEAGKGVGHDNTTTPHDNDSNSKTVSAKKCKEKCVILTLGDSVMGDVYYSMSRQLKNYHANWKIIDAHKVSSGLSKDTYYNWPKVAKKLIEEIKPDYVVMMIGMNDAQGIIDEGKTAQFNTKLWTQVYTKRTQEIYQIISQRSEVIWIQLPNVKSESFESRLASVRSVHESVSGKSYFSVKSVIGDSSSAGFAKYRQNDGIHLNAQGADIIAEKVYKKTMSEK